MAIMGCLEGIPGQRDLQEAVNLFSALDMYNWEKRVVKSMELEMRNEIQQKQVLSQKMIQSVRILEMGADEMESFFNDMAESNPLIDLEKELPDSGEDFKDRLEWERQNDYQSGDWYSSGREEENREESIPGNDGITLEEYLMMQLIPLCRGKYRKDIFYYLVKSLNGWGYLDTDAGGLAKELGLSVVEAEDYLFKLQCLEPAGIGAGDLAECLQIQLMRSYPKERLALRIAEECLELVGKGKFQAAAKQLGEPVDAVKAAAEIIGRLNPKPANGFSNQENLQYVYPDVFIVVRPEGIEVRINDISDSRMKVNPYYLRILEDPAAEEETAAYIRRKLEQVKWAVRCVEQRKTTLEKVGKAIAEWQRAFFADGGGLVPMRLEDIAGETGMHLSTVSRAVKNKYVQCSRGVYPMGSFFAGTVGEHTPEEVKRQMRVIIEEEDKKRPKSDQKIADALEKKGIAVSRRTVAKYRAEMGIAGQGGRRCYVSTETG